MDPRVRARRDDGGFLVVVSLGFLSFCCGSCHDRSSFRVRRRKALLRVFRVRLRTRRRFLRHVHVSIMCNNL